MRKLLLTVMMATLVVMPVLAQFPFGGMMGRGMDGAQLLSLPDVQKDLKLDEDQKKAITEATEARTKAFRSAFQDMDREAMQKAMTDFTKAMTKVKEGLKPQQAKRLLQIEVQVAAKGNQPNIFTNETVQKALKLSDKQKSTVKSMLSELEKDVKELMEDAKGDREKFMGAFKKMQTMGKETFDKITKSFSDEQKQAWKELQGEEFKGELRPAGFRPKKKDDF